MRNYLYRLATDSSGGIIAGFMKALLWVLSWFYGLVVRVLIFMRSRRPKKAGCLVVSVGNITVGGTGKTSLVEFICRYLKDNGRKPAVLTRGYKKPRLAGRRPQCAYETMGDEPYMLQRNLKDVLVIVDADRLRGARQAHDYYGVDTVVLDDGFQQWGIKKDLDIVAIDATDPFGNRNMLPRGILREPLSSLRRADILVLTKTNLNPDNQDIKDFLSGINPRAFIAESIHQPLGCYLLGRENDMLGADFLKGKTLALFSGIADPDSFENLVLSLGAQVGLAFTFDDHHRYTKSDIDGIMAASRQKGISTIVTTEKDAVRLRQVCAGPGNTQILVLRIGLKITHNEKGLLDRLLGIYRP
ncbi:MAG: tetraacyldisaccharide 4'-kinase [Candidatus Omnitrophota bacterium]